MEGASLPQTVVKTKGKTSSVFTSAAGCWFPPMGPSRFQRLDLFTVTLRQIGAYIARPAQGRGEGAGRRRRQQKSHR